MSGSTNREYSFTDLTSVNGYRTRVLPSEASSPAQPLSACCPSEYRSKHCESQKDSISEVTLNSTIYSSKATPRRRVITCKDTNEEMITYHLKLKPESLRYTFSTTEPKKIVYTDNSSGNHGMSRACHSRKRELSSRDSNFSQNCQHGSISERVKSYDEKTTNCRPVINLHTVEFIERTIDKNNRLKRLVRNIVEAREKEKKLEAWNNYINELKSKHANNYHEYLDVPKNYQVERDNTFCRNKVPCRCTWIRPRSSVNNDYCDDSNHSDYIMNLYPNEISCYPISSAAYRSKYKTNDLPRRSYLSKTEYIINAEEENPQKRKRRQLNNDQVRNISAQTSTGIVTTSNDTRIKNLTRNEMKDEIEGYEPCVCAGESIKDTGTNTDKVEQETLTDFTSKACFCNKDQETVQMTKNDQPIIDQELVQVAKNDQPIIDQNESKKTATYVTVTEKMTKLQEEIGQSKTSDNAFGIIEEKLDNIISTMNDLLSEVKLRITDMGNDKFDSATSTTFPHINEKVENCIAHQLLEHEINFPELDDAKQKERYDFDLFQRDNQTINTVHFNSILTPTENTNKNVGSLNTTPISPEKANLNSIKSKTEDRTQIKTILLSTKSILSLPHAENNQEALVPEKLEKKSLRLIEDNGNKSEGKPQPNGDPQSVTLAQPKDDQFLSVEQSIIELKKASKSFMETLNKSGPNLTEDEMNKESETFTSRLKEKFHIKSHQAKHSKENKQKVDSSSEKHQVSKENSDSNQPNNNKSTKKKNNQEFCCVYASLRSIPRPRYRHASVTASLDRQMSNATEIILDVYYSNNNGSDQTMNKLVDRAVSKIDDHIKNTNSKCYNKKLRIAVDRAVSKIDDNVFSVNHQQNYMSVDRAVSKIDDIIIEEINKSNQAKKDINEILNREITKNYGVQITFELPTKERGTEVTDSLSKTRVSGKSSSQGKIYYSRTSRTSPFTIAAVNTDPMSLLGLFRLSTNTMRQLLTFINFDYSSYFPSVSRALPTISEAVQYLCHICGATFRRPSELSNHMRDHNLNSAKDCCVCRHMLQLRQRNLGVFSCRFCGQSFTRAYCCELHERTCGRRRGRRLDVSDSRAILT